MTIVTGISLYSDPGVICVIAVTAQKFDESAFSRSLGAILDAQRLQHLESELTEILRDHIGRDLLLPHFGQQLRGGAYPFGAALHKVLHPKQKFRQLRLVNILAVLALHQLPDKVVKLQGQFLIFHIPPADQQRSSVSTALTAQDEVGVRSADDAGGTADIVKGIVAVLQLSQVMHQQNGNVEAVGNALDGGNVVVVVAIHSRFSGAAFGVPHLLQRVDDDQLGGGVLGQKVRDLLLQPAADQPGGHGKIQVVRGTVGEVIEPVLDTPLGVLKAQIEHIALQRG